MADFAPLDGAALDGAGTSRTVSCSASSSQSSGTIKKVGIIKGAFALSGGNGTFDPSYTDTTNITLSNGNLTASNSNNTASVADCSVSFAANVGGTFDYSFFFLVSSFTGSLDLGVQVSAANGGSDTARPPLYTHGTTQALAMGVSASAGAIQNDDFSITFAQLGALTAGDYFQFRFKNQKLYVRKQNPQGTGTWGAWNGTSGTYSNADPNSNNGIPLTNFNSFALFPYAYIQNGTVTADFSQWVTSSQIVTGVAKTTFHASPSTGVAQAEVIAVKAFGRGFGLVFNQTVKYKASVTKYVQFSLVEAVNLYRRLPPKLLPVTGIANSSSMFKVAGILRGASNAQAFSLGKSALKIVNIASSQSTSFAHSALGRLLPVIQNQVLNVLKVASPAKFTGSIGEVVGQLKTMNKASLNLASSETVSSFAQRTHFQSAAIVNAQVTKLINGIKLVKSILQAQITNDQEAIGAKRSVASPEAISAVKTVGTIRAVAQASSSQLLKMANKVVGIASNSVVSILSPVRRPVIAFIQSAQVVNTRWVSSFKRTLGAIVQAQVAGRQSTVGAVRGTAQSQAAGVRRQGGKLVGLVNAQVAGASFLTAHFRTLATLIGQSLSLRAGTGKIVQLGISSTVQLQRSIGRRIGVLAGQSFNAIKAVSHFVQIGLSQAVAQIGKRSVYTGHFFGQVQQSQSAKTIRSKPLPLGLSQTSAIRFIYGAIIAELENVARIVGRSTAAFINGMTGHQQ